MRIERVELRQIRLPLLFPFETSFGVTRERNIILVRVIDSDGAEGWGECVAESEPLYSEEWTGSAWPALEQFLVPILLANRVESALDVAGLFEHIKGNRMAKAAVETACWDLDARKRNIPLWELLGGTRSEIPCGVSIGLQKSTEALLQKIERELAAGYQRIKIKIKPGHDLKLVDAVRDRFPEIPLMVDANSAYRLKDAALLRDLDRYRLMMIEQPLAHDDIAEHARLQKEISTPICLDESIRSAADARHALELGACRIINIKLGRVGGHSQSMRVEEVCRKQNIPVWCGGMLEAGIGRAHNIALSTLAGFSLPGDVSASSRYWEEDIIDPPVTVTPRGTIVPPTGPGIGFKVRVDRIEKLMTRKLALPSPRPSPNKPGSGSGFLIRDIKGIAEYRAVEQLQKEIWSVTDREILPAIHMIAATAVGAILVGAFDGDELIGFVYGFPGYENEKRIIHSDMLAVRNEYRDHGLGRKLKLAQRDRALAHGIDRITWTFDPLRAKNAYLNLAQLGVVADRYLRDFYGETSSPLHSLGTDRLWVTWHLNGAPTRVDGDTLRIEIPNDISALSARDALRWRNETRRAFEEAFAKGYVATGFERGEVTSKYLLTPATT